MKTKSTKNAALLSLILAAVLFLTASAPVLPVRASESSSASSRSEKIRQSMGSRKASQEEAKEDTKETSQEETQGDKKDTKEDAQKNTREASRKDVPDVYVGSWEYEKYGTFIRIDANGRWIALDKEGNAVSSGHTEQDGIVLYLKNFGGATVFYVIPTREGKLEDGDGDLLFRSELPAQKGEPLESYFGIWQLDGGEIWLDFHPNKKLTYYTNEDGKLFYVYDANYSYSDGKVHAAGSDGETGTGYTVGEVDFTLDGSKDVLYTDNGDAYVRAGLPEHELPVPSDEMNETFRLSACEKFTFHYPDTLTIQEQEANGAMLVPGAASSGSDDSYVHIMPFVLEVDEESDANYNRGQLYASAQIQVDVNHVMDSFFGDQVKTAAAVNFTNGSIYYEVTGLAQLGGEIYESPYSGDVFGGVFVRYCGPYGYMPGIAVIAPSSVFNRYIQTAYQMMDNMTTRYGWRTAAGKKTPTLRDTSVALSSKGKAAVSVPSAKTAAAGKSSGKKSTSTSSGSTTGYSLPRPFYWTDSDGDIWYWNGTENIFYAFGDDFYIDGGEIMESNDAGWTDQFGDYWDDFEYDYVPWYDPWLEDYYDYEYDLSEYYEEWDIDPWSDPGDYYDDYYYYEENDYYDYYDFDEYFDSYDEAYFEEYDYYYDDFNDDYYDDNDYDDYNYDYDDDYDYSYDYDYDYSYDYSYDDYSYDDYSYDDYSYDYGYDDYGYDW